MKNTPEAWTQRANKASTSSEAALWSEDGQRERFEAVLAALDPQPGEHLLDFGCGTGALSELVPPEVFYAGYDWSAGMVRRASREHPNQFFSDQPTLAIFDLVACVGTFNLRDNWMKDDTFRTVSELWSRCRRALAVCLYHGNDPGCISYDDDECVAFAASVPGSFEIMWPRSNDIMVVLRNGL